MQTVHRSAMGVNPLSGYAVDGRTGGHVNADDVQAIRGRIVNGVRARGEVLMPVFDENMVVKGYERHVDPTMQEMTQPNRHRGEMKGAWAGRQKGEKSQSTSTRSSSRPAATPEKGQEGWPGQRKRQPAGQEPEGSDLAAMPRQ